MENNEDSVQPQGISRRQVLQRGAAVGAAAAWTIPLVQVVSMTPAHAASPSAPGGGGNTPTPPPSTAPHTQPPSGHAPGSSPPASHAPAGSTPPGSAPVSAEPTPSSSGAPLASTGASVPVGPAVGIGAAAIALGAGAVAAAQIRRNRPDGSAADTE